MGAMADVCTDGGLLAACDIDCAITFVHVYAKCSELLLAANFDAIDEIEDHAAKAIDGMNDRGLADLTLQDGIIKILLQMQDA